MKILCVDCDEAMGLVETRGPDRGSMTVVFGCPTCGRQTAMLTNASETQVVRSLGVKIGGPTVDAEPMEGIREGLTGALASHGDATVDDHGDGATGAHPAAAPGQASSGSSKCPFTGMVNEAYERTDLAWSDAARARIDKIPSYARSMVIKGVEQFAREEGMTDVTEDVLDRARGHLGL